MSILKIKILIEDIGIYNCKLHLILSCNWYSTAFCLKCVTKEWGRGCPHIRYCPVGTQESFHELAGCVSIQGRKQELKDTQAGSIWIRGSQSGIPTP